MGPQLTPEEIVTLQVLKHKGQSNTQIAQTLGITEGAVRYHVRRQGTQDGRKRKPRKADPLAPAIDGWVLRNHPAAGGDDPGRTVNVQALYDWLRAEHAYAGSYKSVLRFVRARYPRPPAMPLPPRRDAPGRPGPARLGHLRRHRPRRRPRDVVRLRRGPVPLAQGSPGLVPPHGPAGLASRPHRGLPPPGRRPGRAAHRQPQDRGGARGRAVGSGQRRLPLLRPGPGHPRRCLPAPLSRGQGQGREQGRPPQAPAAPRRRALRRPGQFAGRDRRPARRLGGPPRVPGHRGDGRVELARRAAAAAALAGALALGLRRGGDAHRAQGPHRRLRGPLLQRAVRAVRPGGGGARRRRTGAGAARRPRGGRAPAAQRAMAVA